MVKRKYFLWRILHLMASSSFSYRFTGVQGLFTSLNNLNDGLEDFSRPLDEAGIYMHKSIGKNFEQGGRPRWKKHSPLTKKLRGSDAQILRDTGQLMNSVTSKGSGSKYDLSKNRLVIGSNVKAQGSSRLLADIQQNGSPVRVFGKHQGKIPPRPFLVIQDEDERAMKQIFDDYIAGLL